MDGPLGRHDGLLVVQPYHTALLRLSHDMGNGLLLRQVEVVVGLDTATVGVGRHGVPGSTRVQLCQTELQLAGAFLQHIIDDQLIHGAVVALLQGTDWSPHGSLQRALATVEGNPLRLIVLMGSSRVQVELGGIRGILRAEQHLFVHVLVLADVSASDVESLFRRERIHLAVNDDLSVTQTTVHDTNLTVIEEILLLDGGIHVESQLQEVL